MLVHFQLAGDGSAEARARRAYEQTLPELEALGDDEVAYLNLDVELLVTTALGCLPRLRELRGRIAALPEVDQGLVDSLERYTFALAQAHALYMAARGPQRAPKQQVQAARQARDLLRTHLALLRAHGLLDSGEPARHSPGGGALRPLKSPAGRRRSSARAAMRGQRGVCFELLYLCAQFRDSWESIENKTLVTPELLAETEALAHELLTLLGTVRERQTTHERARCAALRSRAFTLFLRAYDQTRRAVSFLLWNERTLDQVMPSLYQGRRGRGGR